MINQHQPRWYHNLMLPFGIQILIVMAAGIITLAQFGVYRGIQENIVVFAGVCEGVLGPVTGQTEDGDDIIRQGAQARCGETIVNLGALENKYLYLLLTAETEPVIVCTKTQSEYLREINWRCEINPEEETEAT